MRSSAVRLYEIEAVVPGASLTLRDLLSGASVTVRERLGSRSLRKWDLVAARLALSAGASGSPEIDDLLPMPPLARDSLVAALTRERSEWMKDRGADDDTEFFKSRALRFHHTWLGVILRPAVPKVVLSDGEEALITRVHFRVQDRGGVIAALDRARDFFCDEEEGSWHWRPPGRKEPPTFLRFEGEELVLEAMTKGASKRARKRIERLLGPMVHPGLTTHEDLAQAMKKPRPPSPPPVDLPEADDFVLEHYERHYRAWLDESIPALDGRTPREAARSEALRPKLVGLLKGLEQMYARSLEMGVPGYDPFWMWEELGLSDRPEAPRRPKAPPRLGHETMARLVPGLAEVARGVAARIRRRADFGLDTVVAQEDLTSDLSARRFLEEHARKALASGLTTSDAAEDANLLGVHLGYFANYELHHRKTFWIEEGLAWMLARTNLDIHGDALRLPFSSFALVFTDRDTLRLAERLLSKEETCTHKGRILQALTVYATAIPTSTPPGVSLSFLFDDHSEDWPYFIQRDLLIEPEAHLEALLESHLADVDPSKRDPVFTSTWFKELVRRTLNAILYATSAGITVETRKAASWRERRLPRAGAAPALSSEEVFYLPGHIDIRELRSLQKVERAPGGGRLLHKFLVRGHWRRANPSWKDQGNRWIQPYWKGPQMATLIERAYRLRPPDDAR
jgi:hypothetical protein